MCDMNEGQAQEMPPQSTSWDPVKSEVAKRSVCFLIVLNVTGLFLAVNQEATAIFIRTFFAVHKKLSVNVNK